MPSHSAVSLGIIALPDGLLINALAPLLATADLLALASSNRATRQLLLSPSLWRRKVFTSFPPLQPSSSPALPLWSEAVQLLQVDRHSRRTQALLDSLVSWPPSSTDSPWSFSSLLLFPNLRRVETKGGVLTSHGGRPRPHSPEEFAIPAVGSLVSLSHLTRISLCMGGQLSVRDLRLLSTLPALASFHAVHMTFATGSEETLEEWKAVSADGTKRGVKRKVSGGEDLQAEHKEVDGEPEHDEGDCSLLRLYSPILLFLHALAAKPSFVHLNLYHCGVTPFIMEHMPVWPHLRCLSLAHNDELNEYAFAEVAARFPSLTSLSSPNCSDEAIDNLVQLPQLQELRFPDYSLDESEEGVKTTVKGFASLGATTTLRSLVYSPERGGDCETPSLASLTAVFTLAHLTRLTVDAGWLYETVCVPLFTQHRFVHLRCLELIAMYSCGFCHCPQTDAALLPLVKPVDSVVFGREERQAARSASQRRSDQEGDIEVELVLPVIPKGNAANFPALECLALPYRSYNQMEEFTGQVSS